MEKELPPFPNQGLWSRPDHFKTIAEEQPGAMLENHPALGRSKLRPVSKADLLDFYRKFTGHEPPTIQERAAQLKAQGKPIPPYLQELLDNQDD